MDFALCHLKEKIELTRDNLLFLLTYNKPTSPIVVEHSQKLDILILEYEKTIKELKKGKLIA